MGHQGNQGRGGPGQEPPPPKNNKAAEKSARPDTDDVPSTEEEIKPGLNQDTSPGAPFSSEPRDEAAGSAGRQ
ncbi:hypothetical protein [Paeniglutamicibacter psychrophenolicus]|uniref:hypothetical protein n=1 Tax=Paeniglutamicibacter psychrophenolicus TaxID=257454 RepID=UPI0027884EAB|nr:hypothetical protein [Paeniglutamicibacter psychrophenolicus]MDQ0096011.1 hypothetical protein [Paeniglutamicibacter psychrophenolicus]